MAEDSEVEEVVVKVEAEAKEEGEVEAGMARQWRDRLWSNLHSKPSDTKTHTATNPKIECTAN